MSQHQLSVSTALLLSGLLTGCALWKPPVQTVVIKPPYLTSAYQCQSAPPVPDATATDTDLAVFLVQLWGAWADCHDQLTAVGEDMAIWDQYAIPTSK